MNVSSKEGSRYIKSDSGKEENAERGGEKVARNSAKYLFPVCFRVPSHKIMPGGIHKFI